MEWWEFTPQRGPRYLLTGIVDVDFDRASNVRATEGIRGLLQWWFHKYFCDFHPKLWGRWTHFDSYFSNGLKPPTRVSPLSSEWSLFWNMTILLFLCTWPLRSFHETTHLPTTAPPQNFPKRKRTGLRIKKQKCQTLVGHQRSTTFGRSSLLWHDLPNLSWPRGWVWFTSWEFSGHVTIPPNATTLFSKKEIASQPYLYRIMKLTMIPPQKNALNKAMLFTCWEKRGGWRGGGNVPFPLNHCFFSNGLGWPHTTLRCEPFEKQHLQRHEGILCSSRLGCWKETFKGRL